MRYTVEAFDKETESLAFEIDLPHRCDAHLAEIMKWSSPQRGDEGYNLNCGQLAAIENLVGRAFYDPDYIFQLTCNLS
ncbi:MULTISPECIES: DUF7683 domain-containing protein [Pseudomonas]|uniref:DUF7683 domain-containing protein n=1 Tax=Pseudomonas chlororaphis TaxID=587753 RepID=UPI000C887487|nr:hypothetical protein [Pseudomonas sp. FW306-2-2C-D06C]PMY45368.1 hypothetical protein C1Y36_09335 [Pseudomonas sp. FW306-2-2C-D06C]PYC38170.1 hypothetical protein DMW99_11645 [Pseudomonas chlororaphis]